MTSTAAAPASGAPAARAADLVLARVHLRLGALALARAELETLAGRDGLDHDGLVDLAEVRWRTGDVVGAGEAAAAALEAGDQPLVALMVAAEAAMDRGRPSEARRYAERALGYGTDAVEPIFAGMPRANVWPVDPLTPPPVAVTLFDDPRGLPSTSSAAMGALAPLDPVAVPDAGMEAAAVHDPPTIGLWDATTDGAPRPPALPDGDVALELARAALHAGRRTDAAIAFGLVLRLAPALAPTVVAALAHDRSPELALTRGDAYRLVGREIEAIRAFAEALASTGAVGAGTGAKSTPSDPTDHDPIPS